MCLNYDIDAILVSDLNMMTKQAFSMQVSLLENCDITVFYILEQLLHLLHI